MGLLDLFRRQPPAPEAPKSKRAAKQQAVDHEANVQRLRQQARRRLLGAAVLVGVAIVAFPIVFETQPRPVPMDLPIVIPDKNEPARVATAPPAPVPASLPEQARVQDEPAPVAETVASAPAPQASPKPAEPPAAPAVARFVVQVGAFADRRAAQEARQKLEAKGLKTYTQVASTKDGDRIRVRLGPFAERADAEKAAAKAKTLGLAGNVLTL